MHQLVFLIKRSHHCALRMARRAAAPFHPKLTPARFDLLYRVFSAPRRAVPQAEIVRALGVTRPTVSRMLRSLLELGWLDRERLEGAGRRWVIFFTQRGLELFGRAAEHLLFPRGLDETLSRWFDPLCTALPNQGYMVMAECSDWLEQWTIDHGDRATLRYPCCDPEG